MRIALTLVVLGGMACGDNISIGAYFAEQRDATCGYYVRCGTVATVADCRAYFERTMTSNASFVAAVEAGKLSYDGAAAEACIDAFDVLDCNYADQGPDALSVCDDVFTGTLEVGETCAFDRECTTDRCVVDVDCLEACCLGTCEEPRRYPGLGEPCTTVCDDDLFCNFDQICQAPLGEGEPCNGFTVCAQPLVCNSYCVQRPARGEPCNGYCAAEGDMCGLDLTCVPAGVEGDDCDTTSECSFFYFCNFDTRTCEVPPVTPGLPNGRTCTLNTECTSRYCDGTCADPPVCY